jgi:hypothetical protein
MRQMDSIDTTRSIEELRPAHTNNFPEELPRRPAPPAAASSWKQRMRGFWTFSLSSYSIIHTSDGAARVRHIAMIAILALRTAMSALSILSEVIKGEHCWYRDLQSTSCSDLLVHGNLLSDHW